MRALTFAAVLLFAAGRIARADDPVPPTAPAGEVTPSAPPAPAPTPPAADVSAPAGASMVCADEELSRRLAALLDAERFADLHHAAVSSRVLCSAELPRAALLDSIALVRLEDRPAAYAQLVSLQRSPIAEHARVVLAWAYMSDRDTAASEAVLRQVPTPRAAAVHALSHVDDRDAFEHDVSALDVKVQALALQSKYDDAHGKSPALAGVLSAILPGSGQLYAGSLQAAAVTFVLNGLFVAATVELARDEKYFTAAAAGTAASFFYVGGIMNAVDLAHRRNERASEPYEKELEKLLVPELGGQISPPP